MRARRAGLLIGTTYQGFAAPSLFEPLGGKLGPQGPAERAAWDASTAACKPDPRRVQYTNTALSAWAAAANCGIKDVKAVERLEKPAAAEARGFEQRGAE